MRNESKPDLLPKAEADDLRKTAVAIWGNQASSWTMNRSLADVTAKAVIDIKDCSNTMSFVPSPVGVTKPTYSYIKNQIKKIVISLLGVKKTDKQNYACIKSVALNQTSRSTYPKKNNTKRKIYFVFFFVLGEI